jgi:polynucleotide 5'-hydroxyl-kinase GRC3/NOL9
MEMIPEPDWESLPGALLLSKGTTMLIGETDSGKSTLAKYLIQRLISEHIPVCLIDADVGQSSLGLPGTICMKPFFNEYDLQSFFYENMSFVGTINPAKNILNIIATVKRMSDECRDIADISLIDTSGLVAGEIGERLKIGKVRTLNASHIIAIQKQDELEHILSLISGATIHRISVSKNIKARPLSTRIRYRNRKYDDYFYKSEMNSFILYSHDAMFCYKDQLFTIKDGVFTKDTVIGLNGDGNTMALGILEDISDNSITFSSPLNSLKNINRVIFSDITYPKEQRSPEKQEKEGSIKRLPIQNK